MGLIGNRGRLRVRARIYRRRNARSGCFARVFVADATLLMAADAAHTATPGLEAGSSIGRLV